MQPGYKKRNGNQKQLISEYNTPNGFPTWNTPVSPFGDDLMETNHERPPENNMHIHDMELTPGKHDDEFLADIDLVNERAVNVLRSSARNSGKNIYHSGRNSARGNNLE